MSFWLIQLLPYFVFAFYQISTRSHGPPAPLPAVFCPSGVPFGPVHFTDYPLKPKYKDYTPEKILKLNLLDHIQTAVRYNCHSLWTFSTPKLFRGKFNYLPAYNIHMELPVTPKPMPAYLPDLSTDHTGKLFGIVYITLTGVIDTIIPVASLWSWVGKFFPYLFKLAHLLWWALPAKTLAQATPENNRPAAQDWIPDSKLNLEEASRAMPVLCLHFQTNTNLYSNDTDKFLGVPSILSGNTLDWFGKAAAKGVKFCLDYSQFEGELMATGNNQDTCHQALINLLDIKQGPHTLQSYINEFLKLKTRTQLEDKLSAILYRWGVCPALKKLLKNHPPHLA
ncbi:hypothetical protein DSO57_1003549 [Entomophthora muscae]|uniref:Uncharacterized protein n=1 Tax=Entomophthora muscae TaxID=34485 RepID=A0ACC2RZK8_9FUNG|nr:hypothetical protein DSO57_1003549 [Entomophthora muscae]